MSPFHSLYPSLSRDLYRDTDLRLRRLKIATGSGTHRVVFAQRPLALLHLVGVLMRQRRGVSKGRLGHGSHLTTARVTRLGIIHRVVRVVVNDGAVVGNFVTVSIVADVAVGGDCDVTVGDAVGSGVTTDSNRDV